MTDFYNSAIDLFGKSAVSTTRLHQNQNQNHLELC